MHIERFKNYHELIGHGDGQSREHALLCLSSVLTAADTYAGAKRIIGKRGKLLEVGVTQPQTSEPS